MQLDGAVGLAEGRPFGGGFLDAVLAEDALALVEHGLDPVERLLLGDGDEGDGIARPAGLGEGAVDAGADGGQRHGRPRWSEPAP